jgi:uncharacterized transporter YbjL
MDAETCSRREAIARIAFAVLVVLASAGLISAAALVPAPPLVLPLIAIVSVGGPMTVTPELQAGIQALRRQRRAMATLRKTLAELPETAHPLERG